MTRAQRGLALLTFAFVLRIATVLLGAFVSQLGGRALKVAGFAPLVVALVTLLGFQLLGRGEQRSALFAQLAAALASTELLFDLVLLAAPMRLAGFDNLSHLLALLSLLVVLATWATLQAVVTERGATTPVAYSALFYFAVAMSVGLHVQRVLQHRPPIDAHHLDPAGAASLIVSLAVPLLELLLAGIARRAPGKAPPLPA